MQLVENAVNYARDLVIGCVDWIERNPALACGLWIVSIILALAV
jgi:hypothetical protein